jgi:hypothetical protein
LILAIVNSIAPVFLVIVLGILLYRHRFLSAAAVRDMARLTYWVGIPCLLFVEIAGSRPVLGDAGRLFLVVAGATGIGMLLGVGLARPFGLPRASTGTFLQAMFRGNLAFVGLPVILYAFSASGRDAEAAEAAALVAMGPMIVLYNVAAVLALLLSRRRIDRHTFTVLIRELATNPLLIACGIGVVCALAGWTLPLLVKRTLAAVGQLALPLALLGLGGSLAAMRLQGSLGWAATAAAGKLLLLPLLGYTLAWLFDLNPESRRIALILLACPTATVSYILVDQLGGDLALASGAILLSTVFAALPLAVILAVG